MTREEAIQVLQTALTSPFIYGEYADAISMAIEALSAEAVQGEWILKEHLWECDQCGCRINRTNPLKGNIWNYNYCPNCGSRMTPYKGGDSE